MPGRILEPPVDVALARQDRADVAAAHRHDHVRPGRVRLGLELPRRPAGEVVADLAHRLDHLRVQVGLGAAAGGAHLVAAAALEERVRHLGAAGVADAEEEDVGHEP